MHMLSQPLVHAPSRSIFTYLAAWEGQLVDYVAFARCRECFASWSPAFGSVLSHELPSLLGAKSTSRFSYRFPKFLNIGEVP